MFAEKIFSVTVMNENRVENFERNRKTIMMELRNRNLIRVTTE